MLMSVLGAVFAAYSEDYGSLPPSSENYLLVQTFSGDNPHKSSYFLPKPSELNVNHEYADGWGTPLRFVFKGKDDVLIISAGPDKIFGTADDITSQGKTNRLPP
jgi:hypothetical protein